MGADYIPEDNILTRQTRERTDLLLKSAQEANFNSLRIWGGGYFLDDFFYDVCDERGLLIWHDFMFACASYELSDHLRRISPQKSVRMYADFVLMQASLCGAETMRWRHSTK